MKKYFLLLGVAVALSGCSLLNFSSNKEQITTVSVIPDNYKPKLTVIGLPEIGQTKEINVGDTLVSQQIQKRTMALYINKSFVVDSMTIPSGIYEMLGSDSKANYFADANTADGYKSLLNASGNGDIMGFTVPKTVKDTVCVLTISKGERCIGGVAYQIKERTIIYDKPMQKHLIYMGKNKNLAKIGYRELRNDIVIPSANEDVDYNLSESDIIAFKEARIRVIRVTNETIRYRVIKNFSE